MRKLISLILISLCFVPSAFAVSLADALEWKYGPVANTCQEDPSDTSQNPKMVICGWKSDLPQPTKPEIQQIKSDYQQYLIDQKAARKLAKKAVATKLSLNATEITALADLVQDRNDN